MIVHSGPSRRTSSNRPGLTLFEVVISLSIFLVAMVPLWHLVNIGSERALDVQQQAQASLLCQAKLAEVISGAESLSSGGPNPFKEDSAKDWQWRLDASEDVTGLWRVRVTVQRDRADGSTFEVSLSQMVLDPAVRGSTLSTSVSGGSSGASSGSGSGSSSGGSTSGGSTSGGSTSGGSAAAASSGGASTGKTSGASTGKTGGAASSTGSSSTGLSSKSSSSMGGSTQPATSRGSSTVGGAPGAGATVGGAPGTGTTSGTSSSKGSSTTTTNKTGGKQ
ncbi:MAG: hypothetical protein HY040_20185 [Planctomycetes bacterium]|nr:hypothetical protein [Planctomycetota bacterium]